MTRILSISAFTDNYIWLIIGNNNHCVIIDPGDAKPVIKRIEQLALVPAAILITHGHNDHTAGIPALLQQYPSLPVYGPDSLLNHYSTNTVTAVKEPDSFTVANTELHFDVLSIPGHTLDHLAFLFEDHCFCGDTLFSAGCGRLFEGSATQLHHSLQKLAHLPRSTLFYPAHEYTYANLIFASHVDPNNIAVKQRLKIVNRNSQQGIPSLPVTLDVELETNPFLRCHTDEIKAAIEAHAMCECSTEEQLFAQLRRWKDTF